jgi:hypothetical protein
MIGPRNTASWVGLLCDASSATVFAARGVGPDATPFARRQLEYDPVQLQHSHRLEPLEQFVRENRLKGRPIRVAFSGSGAIVQRLTLPPLCARDQLQAVRTHLGNYADGRELIVAVTREPETPPRKSVRLLAAGVDLVLGRSLHAACQRAGLRVAAMTALATACGPVTNDGALVQLILGERTTTIQLFQDGRLIASRDVLPGWRDFLQAYQRPILTDHGPITLAREQADALLREVGIPVDREDEVRPGVLAAQLWPTLNPVLQKLSHEIEQSLSYSQWERPEDARVSVLGLPAPRGLDVFLATELQLRGAAPAPMSPQASYLSAFSGQGRPLDLRPPERQFAARMTKPALAAGLCALLIILANSVTPRQAEARLAELRPVAKQLHVQFAAAREKRARILDSVAEPAAELRRANQLLQALPATIPTTGPLKVVFRSAPPEVELLEVQVSDGNGVATMIIRAAYRGQVPASILAARWGRELCESVFFNDARVTSVTGAGQAEPAVFEIQAELKGG